MSDLGDASLSADAEPTPTVGGGLGAILAVSSLTFRESARNRILHALVFATLVACAGSYLFSYAAGADNEVLRHRKVVLDLSLSAISLLGTIAVIFLGTNLIYQEVERRTIYTILARPISRAGFIVGKYLGLAAVMGVAVFFMSVGFLILFALGGGSPTLSLLLALFFVYVELLVVLAVAVFFSVAAHPIEGAVFSFIVTVAGHVTESLNDLGTELVKPTATFEPTFFHERMQDFLYVVYVLFPNLENFNLKAMATYGLPLDSGHLSAALAYGLVYAAVLLALSCLIFRRKVL